MRWEDERYVRLYTRDSVDWHFLSFEAQGLFCLLLKKADRAGIIRFGRHGAKGIASLLGHPSRVEAITAALDELVRDGCVRMGDDALIFPNFIEAQEAKSSDTARKRAERERARDLKMSSAVTQRDQPSQNVTTCPPGGQNVTRGHAESHAVTPSRAVPSRAEPAVPSEREALAPLQKNSAPTGSENTPRGQVSKTPYSAATERPSAVQTRTPLDAVKAAWERVHGKPPVGWGLREERDLAPVAALPVEEIEAVAEVAFQARGFKVDGRPEIRTVRDLVQHWDRFAPDAATATASPRPLCAACGRVSDGRFWEQPMCHPCGFAAIEQDGIRTVIDMEKWVQARKESAA